MSAILCSNRKLTLSPDNAKLSKECSCGNFGALTNLARANVSVLVRADAEGTATSAINVAANTSDSNPSNDSHFTPKERAALHYARELTRTASVSDDLRYHAEELFTTDEIVELTMVIGLANFTNRFNNGLAVPPE